MWHSIVGQTESNFWSCCLHLQGRTVYLKHWYSCSTLQKTLYSPRCKWVIIPSFDFTVHPRNPAATWLSYTYAHTISFQWVHFHEHLVHTYYGSAIIYKTGNICINITMSYVCAKCVAVEKQQVLHILSVCSLSYLACNVHALHYTVTCLVLSYFFTLFHKWHIFRKNGLSIKCFTFLYNFCLQYSSF